MDEQHDSYFRVDKNSSTQELEYALATLKNMKSAGTHIGRNIDDEIRRIEKILEERK